MHDRMKNVFYYRLAKDYNIPANCGPQRPLVRWPAATVRPGGQG